MSNEEIEKELEKLAKLDFNDCGNATQTSQRTLNAIAMLGISILRLDKTSTRLITITNYLTGVVLALTVVQAGIAVYLFLQH